MENNTEETKDGKKRMPLIPILAVLSVLALGFWFGLGQDTKTTSLANGEENHAEDDGHGHEAGDVQEKEGHEEGEDAHGEHGEEEGIKLSEAEMKEFGIKVVKADAGTLSRYADLPGEVRANGDRLAHIVPRVPGVVRKVFKGLGDRVKKGEVMAILDSRELSDSKAGFLAASERVGLAEVNFTREESLWKKKISSEQEYLEAKQVLAEAQIERRSAEQKLHALGFSNRYLKDLSRHPEESFTQYKIMAPFSGTVIEKHITRGEVLKDDTSAFVVADLSSVWVDLSVYQKDLAEISEGQSVVIKTMQGRIKTEGKISYLGPVVGEDTRTALARIVLENKDGQWRPGLFVNARVAVGKIESDLIVLKSAIQKINDEDILFVMAHDALQPKAVKRGRSDETHVEIIEGIYWGDTYVAEGAFTLRAQMGVGDLDDGHNH
ncbi:MAG: efflux RND transporter periplasmic adaptor subunit [Nitrospirae bacterium]|nr:efflux RND transporter periplasmic adaptor subunit [Candidatus Manganitrophaceae bacterium]